MPGRRSPKVFLSYRRVDSELPAGWLRQLLADAFGPENVFMDVDSIRPGDDFAAVIEGAVSTCDVLLALIGRQWSTVLGADGRRRIDAPNDLVRVEIEAALRRDVRVIPVLVGGALPAADELPGELAGLRRRHAVSLDLHRFEADARRLVAAIAASAGFDCPLIVPGAAVAEVELGAPEDAIVAALGPADRVTTDGGTGEVEYTYYDRGLQTYALDGVVGGFFLVGLPEDGFTAFSARTAEGIGAGSPRSDVEAAFGPPDRLERGTDGAALDAARYLSRGIAFCYPTSWSDRLSAPVAAVVVVPPEASRRP